MYTKKCFFLNFIDVLIRRTWASRILCANPILEVIGLVTTVFNHITKILWSSSFIKND